MLIVNAFAFVDFSKLVSSFQYYLCAYKLSIETILLEANAEMGSIWLFVLADMKDLAAADIATIVVFK